MAILKQCLEAIGYAQLLALCVARLTPALNQVSRPNIVMIMTDDQDVRLNSLDFQPAVEEYFMQQGTKFEKHYCTVAQCCPSRVSLLTGKATHNTNVTDIIAPYGGYGKFVDKGLNGQWMPSWFQEAGYNTYYTGKLMNNHSIDNYNKPFPLGFNATDFLVDPGTYLYYNATMQSNQDTPRNIPRQYSTNVVAQRAIDFMKAGKDSGKPFFLTVAPVGPHGQTLFPFTVQNPTRRVSFNKNITKAPSYVAELPEWNQTVVDYYDEFYRLRLATLASVDDLVTSVMKSAENLSLLDNTYFIYTSDNGYHIGQHRLPAGKSCGYEEDINVPFIIRGPGIAKNHVYHAATSHTDIAPALFSLAGIPLRDDFDGQAMPVFNGTDRTSHHHIFAAMPKQEHINVEFWGSQLREGKYGRDLITAKAGANNTCKAVRLISDAYDYYYAVWCSGGHELCEMKQDPYQTSNLAVSLATGNEETRDIHQIQSRLDMLLMVLKRRKAETCRNPWKMMHPNGDVGSFAGAMNAKFDDCYQNQPRVQFSSCQPGYIKETELPDASSIKQC